MPSPPSDDAKRSGRQRMRGLCAQCKSALRQSIILNDSSFASHLSMSEITSGDPRLPLREYVEELSPFHESSLCQFESEVPHHSSASELYNCAKEECQLCSLLWHNFSLDRYSIERCTVNATVKARSEQSRECAQDMLRNTPARIFMRFFAPVEMISEFPAGIILYCGSHPDTIPTLRSCLCLKNSNDPLMRASPVDSNTDVHFICSSTPPVSYY